MTMYAKQDKKLFCIGKDHIEKGIYQCIDCKYALEPVFKNGECSHFKHEANSRKAHQLAHDELCSQMSTDFKDSDSSGRKAAYDRKTIEVLIKQAEEGLMDPQSYMWLIKQYMEEDSASRADLKVALRNLEESLKPMKLKLEQKLLDLDNQEAALNEFALRVITNRSAIDIEGWSRNKRKDPKSSFQMIGRIGTDIYYRYELENIWKSMR